MRDTVRDGCSPNRYRTIVADPPWPQVALPLLHAWRLADDALAHFTFPCHVDIEAAR